VTLYRVKRVPVFYVQYEAAPSSGSEHFDTAGGAYVNCWVRASSEREAREQTSAAIKESGWIVLAVEDQCREVTERAYAESDEGLDHYRQAVMDGECYVFHQWPVEPQEGDDVH
jgi:hypothetical protein